MWKTRNVILLFIIIGTLWSANQSVAAPDERVGGKLIIVSVPGLSFLEMDELEQYTGWQQLLSGKVAAMNVRTPEAGIEDTYLSINAGAPAIVWSSAQSSMKTDMHGDITAEQLVFTYTGQRPDGNIVIPAWIEVLKLNRGQDYSAVPGYLGEILRNHGIARYVYGNRDRIDADVQGALIPFRHAPLMLADRRGEVPFGDIGANMNVVSRERPFSLRTNDDALLNQLKQITHPSVVLVELSDLDRLYGEQSRMTSERFAAMKETVLTEMGFFLSEIIRDMQSDDSLWLFSPLTHPGARRSKSLFTPFIMFDHANDREHGEWLTSSTTKRAGIVTYADLTASILHHFGLAVPAEMRGNAAETVQTEGQAGIFALTQKVKKIEYVYKLRPRLIYPLVTFQMVTLLVSLVYLMWRKKWNNGLLLWHERLPKRFCRLLTILLYAVGIAPFLLLFVGAWTKVPQNQLIFLFYFILLIAAWLLSRLPLYLSYILLGFVTATAIFVDGLFDAHFMKYSVLGYDPIIGARFYGIGNEYMGALIGAFILAFSVLHQQVTSMKWKKVTLMGAAVCGVGLLAYLAAPSLGTNAGGAISAAVAFTAFLMFILQKQSKVKLRKFVLIGGIGIFISLFSLWLLNRLIAPSASEMSHIGKAMGQLFSGRFDLIADTIYRKLSMNLRLIGVSSWSKLLTSGLVVIFVLSLYSRTNHFKRWKNGNPSISSGLSAILFGAVTAFLVNDSGIVAAAVMIIYAAVPMLLVHLNYSSDSHSENKGSS